jgi:ABC-2 type transport system ATP-binding protein
MEIIKLFNVSKRFDKENVISSINLSVKAGEIFGLLGPNGAGKTTLISMLSTLLSQDNGEIYICGYSLKKYPKEIRKKMSIVFQEFYLDDRLIVYDNLDFYSRLYKIPKYERKKAISEVISLMGLQKELFKITGKLSGGMKKRLDIARALLHKPKLLLLDEPTQGLDPIAKNKLRQYIRKINKKENITIFMSTHDLSETEKLCSRIAIMNKGKIIKIGSVNQIKKTIKNKPSLEGAFIHLTK